MFVGHVGVIVGMEATMRLTFTKRLLGVEGSLSV